MEVLVSIVGSLAGKVAEYAVDPIAQQLGYLFKHESKFQNLRSKVYELSGARQEVLQSFIFESWLTEANTISEQAANQLQEVEEKAKKRCFVGFCPDFKCRYQLSKKAENQTNAIAELLAKKDRLKKEDGQLNRVAECCALEGLGTRPVKEYVAFGSRGDALKGVMAALKDDNFNIIGVYGLGGVGKTTLVKEAARQANENKLFHKVVLVAIAQTPNMVHIQNVIAEQIGLKIDVTGMDVRAALLRERLKLEKKVLIILDDIWVMLDLEALGIPSVDEHKGFKILMTSRKIDVLESMNSQKNLAVEVLEKDEAWNLFKNMAGQIVERSDLQSTAFEVAQKCDRLPIAIVTIAKALKHKQDLSEWKNALRDLRSPSERNFKGITGEAYSSIELSYKFLEGEEQPIFLLCSIMGHNAAIEDLLRYGMGLGLFHGVNTLQEAQDKVLTVVRNLKASCLLFDGSDPTHFDMLDVVRDVAISIASRDQHWLSLGKDDVFKKWSGENNEKVQADKLTVC